MQQQAAPPAEADTDGRLGLDAFEKRYGRITSHAIAFDASGHMVINSALTRSKYIAYDWSARVYTVESR